MRAALAIGAFGALLLGGVLWLALADDGAAQDGAAAPPRAAQGEPAGTSRGPDGGPARLDGAEAPGGRVAEARGGEPSGTAARPQASEPPIVRVRGIVRDERGAAVGAQVLLGATWGAPPLPVDAEGHPARRRGEVVAGASVAAEGGAFALELPAVPGGRYSLSVRSPGFADVDRHDLALLALPAGAPPQELDAVVLERGVTVLGRVVDEAGQAVGGAEIRRAADAGGGALAPCGLVSTSAIDGSFAVGSLPAGPLALVATARDHVSGEWRGAASAPGQRVADARIVLARGHGVEGRLVDGRGDGVPGAVVLAADERGRELGTAETDGDGAFRLTALPESARLSLRARRAEPAAPPRWLTDAREAYAGTRGVELVLVPSCGARLVVVEEPGGRPVVPEAVVAHLALGGAAGRTEQVQLDAQGEWRSSDDGAVAIPRLPWTRRGASVQVEVRAGGRSARSRPFELAPGATEDLGELMLGSLAELRVRVVDPAGEPVAGATVHLEEAAGSARSASSATTDRSGEARVAAPEGAACRAWAEHPDHSPSPETQVAARAGAELVLALRPATALEVQVTDPAGAPLAARLVEARRHRQGEATPSAVQRAAADGQGRASFSGLAPGAWRVGLAEASPAERRALQEHNPGAASDGFVALSLAAGERGALRLVVPRLVALAGRVSAEGAPLAGAVLRLYADRRDALDAEAGFTARSELSARTDGRGEFRIEGLVPGRYAGTAAHADLAMPQHFAVEVTDVGSRMDLDLPVLVVEGRVTFPDGAPAAGVRVRAARPADGEPELDDWMRVGLAGEAARGTAATATTGSDGAFALRGVDAVAGALQLVAEGPAVRAVRSEVFDFSDGARRRRVDLTVVPGASVRVRVESAGGDPTGWQLVAQDPRDGAERRSAPCGPDGLARLEGLPVGRCLLRLSSVARDAGTAPDPLEVELVAGQALELVLTVP